jgi:NAD(P)-dependent dehydrogenase (short-subunit alcohol dehydrogenase family)
LPQLNDDLLAGKAVLINGGTQGLGAAVSAAAARNGADVTVTGRRRDVGERFAADPAATSGRRVVFVRADAGDVEEGRAAVAEAVKRFEQPADVLAAGVHGIVIASSTATHPDLIRACARAGIPTFCEKPVAALSREAFALHPPRRRRGLARRRGRDPLLA